MQQHFYKLVAIYVNIYQVLTGITWGDLSLAESCELVDLATDTMGACAVKVMQNRHL